MGLANPPAGLFYSKVSGPFRSIIPSIRPQIQREGIEFIVIDSMGAA